MIAAIYAPVQDITRNTPSCRNLHGWNVKEKWQVDPHRQAFFAAQSQAAASPRVLREHFRTLDLNITFYNSSRKAPSGGS